MTNPRVLNLDELETPVAKTLIVNSVRHEMRSFTVGALIESLKEAENTAKEVSEDDIGGSLAKTVEFMVNGILRAFPTLSKEDLSGIDADKIGAIYQFIREDETNEVKEALNKAKDAEGNAKAEPPTT